MKKKIIFLLTSCCLLLCGQILKANHADPLIVAAETPLCTLAAPANLQFTPMAPNMVQFTWDTVSGAVGYRGVLTNLSNGTQTVNVGMPTNFNYAVNPGDHYEFVVAAICTLNPPESSKNSSQLRFMAPTIIIDLIVKVYGCIPTGTPIFSSNTSSNTVNYNWVQDQPYYFELTKYIPPKPKFGEPPTDGPGFAQKVYLMFRRTADGYELAEFDSNYEPSVLCGQPNPPPPPPDNCINAPVFDVSNTKFTFGGRTCRIAFPSMAEIHYYYDSNLGSNELPFDYFRIYEGCGGDRAGGAETPPFQVAAVNPFTDQLTLHFAAPPDNPVKTRLFDLQGIPKIETLIQPGQLSGNAYVIPTDALPAGMYFLHMETTSGQVVVQKVLKI